MLSLRHTLGHRIDDVPKGKGNQHVQSVPGDTLLKRGDLPFPRKTRARYLKLKAIEKTIPAGAIKDFQSTGNLLDAATSPISVTRRGQM